MAAAGRAAPVLAKIERAEAVDRLDEVIDAFDGIMVARGDLGVELPLEQVPMVQKRAIRRCLARAKPVIVATQMLDSMIHARRPTRAEVSDVANAVLDGADALMLSAETSVGEHPQEAVRVMARIIAAAEADAPARPGAAEDAGTPRAADALAAAAVELADRLEARALAGFTASGATARWLARHRPRRPLLAFVTDPALRDRLALTWGVRAFVVPAVADTDAMVLQVERAVLDAGLAAPRRAGGDRGRRPTRDGRLDQHHSRAPAGRATSVGPASFNPAH
jgi:pyruvate kinase